jgi:predicted nucleic acid-binding protein
VDPLSAEEAIGHVRSWLERPQVQILQPGARHLDLLDHLMQEAPASGRLTTDSHLAALAIEHQADLHSNDSDFSRFPGLRWTNPLQPSS